MNYWFISDLHLKDIKERNSQILLRFLFGLNQDPKKNTLFLLGDIFDFWMSNGKAFQQHYQPIVDALAYFKKNGGSVYYYEGNHDFHVDVFWTKKLGIPVIDDYNYMQIGGLNVRLEHGDFINPQDINYLQYREKIRRPWVEFLAHILPGSFLKWIGDTMSSKSRKKTMKYSEANQDEIKNMIRSHAQKVYLEKPFDLIVTGHMHVEDDYMFKVDGKEVRSINLGTWLNRPVSLKIENNKIEWILLT